MLINFIITGAKKGPNWQPVQLKPIQFSAFQLVTAPTYVLLTT